MDGDDADSGTGRVGDDDGLRLVTGESVVEHRDHRRPGPEGQRVQSVSLLIN